MASITIIGTGHMAQNLGTGWANAGHTIVVGSRTPNAKADFTTKVKGCKLIDPATALEGVDIAVLTLPFTAVETFARDHAGRLLGLDPV
jgi:predicted dinucleotide-binding enzyme